MRSILSRLPLSVALAAALAPAAQAQLNPAAAMHWREIGPTRAGRARALAGVPSQRNVFYAGFDNGGVWRSTDYGSNWVPLFDAQSTGSIGAIAVSPTNPDIIYVGTGAGIIRPDLATGNGMYKSTDGGKTWTHIGLDDTQMIAQVEVDPKNPDRVFVAALGHPYGPNAERGIFRSLDGGKTWKKVLYKDEYTSGNDVRIDPSDPNTVYAALWQQQQSYIEGGSFGGASGGVYKSTDGGETWTQLGGGLPDVLQANLAMAPSAPGTLYAMVAGALPNGNTNFGGGQIGLYKSTDAGAHWTLVDGPGVQGHPADDRPLARIGGGDLPTITVDPTDANTIYSAAVVMWRSENGGASWTAVRGAPGGDDYQKIWVNPVDPNIILVVSDQGAVVSANRGFSWSNWYNQPTAAMYHVSTDNAFPYRVCSGQQDSGSACVESRSMDGEITFHDWHPVNIQEYGIAAPDPRDADKVYGSMRTGVSRYDRTTGQTAYVGPSAEQRGTQYGRNVRTMPIAFSPVRPDALYYTSNVVWKSTDHARTWTRVSPDLARQQWTVPATAGKYASTVTPQPAGSITALALSPKQFGVMWAGTDDGNVQVSNDDGAHWSNVTPSGIVAWTRIFNIDAGHFDTRTAYIAANTMRVDDMNPHFYRTHDGGKTWTQINNGIAAGAVSNAIREDPTVPGLLYAATDQQVWVSWDDGDHWQSLRLDMPAISVRDIQVKDDATCHCADLIAGTHGRGFWILDDLTPIRQAAQMRAAEGSHASYLVKPLTAVRMRYGTNDPTPWPPELPAGENPPPGAVLDYFLGANATGPVTIDIVDAAGKLVRHLSSTDPVQSPHPALDPVRYDEICHRHPDAPNCDVPLYWPAPPMVVGTTAGAHRLSWDMRYAPVGSENAPGGEDDATGAVPRHSYPTVNAPWAPPGNYTVRLTVDGKTYSQPLTIVLDPRVKLSAADVARKSAMVKRVYGEVQALEVASEAARALSVKVGDATLKAQIDSISVAPSSGGRRRFGRGGASNAPVTLAAARGALMGALMATQTADVAPTAEQLAAITRAEAQANAVLAKWRGLEAKAGH